MKDSATPTFSVSNEGNITITIPQTQALLQDQGYTYNQSGFTYNQIGVQYGGIYNFNEDTIPMVLTTNFSIPTNVLSISDQYLPGVPGYSLGPGWFMYITIPHRVGV